MSEERERLDRSRFLMRETLAVALLTGLTVVLFLAVAFLSRAYQSQEQSLANRWSAQGSRDLSAQRFSQAVTDFHSALLHSRDNFSYQLNLAEALIGLNRTDEAQAYLMNLWTQQPENGLVSLELARIAAKKGDWEQALRFYHNAIYANWEDGAEDQRQKAHWELVEYLLRNGARTQAQSELIALAANTGDDAAQQARLGQFFIVAQDYEHALTAYRISFRTERHNEAALAGAGFAAFQLGRYSMAQRYLQAAVLTSPTDTKSAALLNTTELVLSMDPFREQISPARRDQIAAADFAAAGMRLNSCLASQGHNAPQALQDSEKNWTKLKPQITARGLRQNATLVNAALNLTFKIERQTRDACGSPSGIDTALLLIANLHEEN